MPKTNAERAAHLIQAYIDSDNGKNANADVQYIQSMKTSLDEKFQKLQNEDRRAPLPFMTMKTRYSELDEKLRETADYIKAGNVDPKELENKQARIINLIGGLRSDHRDVRTVLEDPDNDDRELYQELFAGYDNKKLDEMEVGTPLNSIVQTQIDKTNQTRGVNQTNGSFVTKDLIAKEGKEKLADYERRLGLNTEFNDGMDLGHEPGPLF